MECSSPARPTLLGCFFAATVAKYWTTTTDVLTAASSVNHRFKTQRCFEKLRAAILKSPLRFGRNYITSWHCHGNVLFPRFTTDWQESVLFKKLCCQHSWFETDTDCCDYWNLSFGRQFCHLAADTDMTFVAHKTSGFGLLMNFILSSSSIVF